MAAEKVDLSEIIIDPSIQPRVTGLDDEHVADIRRAYEAGEDLPRPVVWRVGGRLKLSQGFHRVEAAKRAGHAFLVCDVHVGNETEWLDDADCSNQDHGLKRTNADKRRATERMLGRHPDWTDRRLADRLGVSHTFVANVRGELATVASSTPVRTSTSGRQYKVPDRGSSLFDRTKNPPKTTVRTDEPLPAPRPKPAPDLPPLKPPHVSANPLSWSGRLEEAVRAIEEAENIVGYALIWPTADGLVRQAGDLKWARSPDEADRGSQVCPETLRLKAYLRSLAALLAKRFNRAA